MTPAPLVEIRGSAAPASPASSRLPSLHGRFELLRVVRTIVRADSDPARQTLFARVVQARPLVGFVYRLHERLAGSRPAAFLVSLYGVAAFLRVGLPDSERARVLGVASHENAHAQVTHVMAWLGQARCGWIRTGVPSLSAAWTLVCAQESRAALRLVARVDRRHGFLVGCRVAAALAWYARATAILSHHRPGAVLVSSDANPEEAGFLGAARTLRIPQVFVSHAYPTPFAPPLDFTLSILEGDAAVEAHRQKGPLKGQVLLAGVEGESAPIDPSRCARPNPVVGIFPPKVFSWATLVAIIDDCRRHVRAKQIIIRWHPSMLEPSRLAREVPDLTDIVETDRSATLAAVAKRCDWVVAGENSNVHLPVLKLGIPTVVVKGLGLYTDDRSDLYGFVASGIVFPPVATLRELSPEAVEAFFASAWTSRFARYDASYLRPRSEVGDEVRRAILALVDGCPREVPSP